jgi:hypothetical protein
MRPCGQLIRAAILCVLILVASLPGDARAGEGPHEQQQFFANLTKLCGRTIEGATEFPENADHPMVGKKLTLNFASCSDTEMRIPLQVGEDKSRTWVLTVRDGKLLLKHDHRHADGTPDQQTNYGGWAMDQGTAQRQRFAADDETAKLIPEAATNIWTLEIDSENQRLIYALERHNAPRYKAAFSLKPAAP